MKSADNKKTVFLAMSGGVDSSVAALLLKKQGYNVVGVFMKYWYNTDSYGSETDLNGYNRCCSLEARQDAMRVCAALKIPFLTWDFQKEFKKAVVDNFVAGYKKGITPNPCVICNKKIKLGMFLEKALKEGADYVATGHYVRLQRKFSNKSKTRNPKQLKIENLKLKIARDGAKDQSYFLWTLTQKQLRYCLFPLGDYTKTEVREIAKKAKLPVALKKDSQEVCFVKDADLCGFLRTRIHADSGPIIELKTGKQIGEHDGAKFYTIGQRVPISGIGPYYVVKKDLGKNQLIVARKDDKSLYKKEAIVKNVNFIDNQLMTNDTQQILVRTRYRQPLISAQLTCCKSSVVSCKLVFAKPQFAITPGQSAVFYSRKNELLGGGIIV